MKKLIFLLSLFSFAFSSFAQDLDWLWAKSGGGTNYDFAKSVCTDLAGNVYVTGSFQSPSIAFGSNILINTGFENIYFVKYDMNGNVLWAKNFGTAEGYVCAADADGFVYLLGAFTDSLILGTDTLFSAGVNFFLAKFDSSGNGLWARTADSGYSALVYSSAPSGMCIDSSGNIYFTGSYADSTSLGGHVLFGPGVEILLAKYDSAGNVLWVRSAGGMNNTVGTACTSDADGNVFVTGWFTNLYMYIGTDTLINSDSGTAEIFLAKYDSSGNFLWAKSAGGSDSEVPNSIAADSAGNVFIAGRFVGASTTFGTNTLSNPSPGFDHTFLAKYDSSGNVLWADAPTGSWDEGMGLAADRTGNVYMTGYFLSSQITFGTITLSRVPNFDADLYVVKYDANGNVLWAKRAGNTSFDEQGASIALDINSDIYILGVFNDTQPLSFGTSNIITNGLGDVFLAKLSHAVGIEEIASALSFSIFPNPSEGKINVRCSRSVDEIKITGLLGQIIYMVKPKEEYACLQISEPGMYLISVRTGNEMTTKKLIINR